MIRRTFQLTRGIGPARERELWAQGIDTWDRFSAASQTILSARLEEQTRKNVEKAERALKERNILSLAGLIPAREHWRLYPELWQEAVFLDIETDGSAIQNPTVVSLFHAQGFEVFIQGRNLEALPAALARWPLWVTFNGSCFDVPVLAAHFRELPKPAVHLDLRFLCHKLGLRGGLKKIEDILGFSRPPHMHGVDGWDAVLLWRSYSQFADLEALRFLVEYNLYDTIQLRTLADIAFNRAVEQSGFEGDKLPVFERGEIIYDVTRYLLCLSPGDGQAGLINRVREQGRDCAGR